MTTDSAVVLIGVIDTGVKYDHPDLYRNIWINQGEIPPTIRAQLSDIDGDGRISFSDLADPINQGPGKITDLNGNGYVDGGDLLEIVTTGGWADGSNNDNNAYVDDLIGHDFADNDRRPMDDDGHGTHVSGIIAARGNNGQGVVGVMWRAKIVALKNGFPESGCAGVSSSIAAIQYCVQTRTDGDPSNDVKVINASWGMGFHCPALYDAIAAARDQGILFIASAGNDGKNNDVFHHYPSNYGWRHTHLGTLILPLDNVIAVAATDNDDLRAMFVWPFSSNYGPESVHLGAPGRNIYSTVHTAGPGSYSFLNGTSMAAPHVAGVAGLVWSRIPSLSYLEVKGQILSTVRPVAALDKDNDIGGVNMGGVVDAYRALLWDCDGNCSNPLCVGVGPDCNNNCIYDGCDIASGFECDVNVDGLPDSCGACCLPSGSCEHRQETSCQGEGESWVSGVACSECACRPCACCLGAACTAGLTDCDCIARGGHPEFSLSCACSLGVCCQDLPVTRCFAAPTGASDCVTDERYIGGASCTEVDVCKTFTCPYACCSDADCPGQRCCCGVCKNACAEPLGVPMNRYIALTVPEPITELTAIRITLSSLHHPLPPIPTGTPDFSAFEGQVRYATLPETGLGTGVCRDSILRNTTFRCGFLSCTPEYRNWGNELSGATLHVTGDGIIPSSTYGIELLADSCRGNESKCSAKFCALRVISARWGNVDGSGTNAAADVSVLDVSKIVEKVRDLATGTVIKPQSQLQPNVPNLLGNVNVLDVANAVDAVKFKAYPFSGPCTCPVRACVPCTSSDNCNGDLCIDGTCRDACKQCDSTP